MRHAIQWALTSGAVTVVEPDPSLPGFIRNASVIGSIIAAGWLIEARIGKKIGSAIEQHTAVEEARLGTVKAEFAGTVGRLEEKIDGLHLKLDARPCAATCVRRGE